ncbi:acetate--CoA ligase family protein [Castellaniella sp.]|uniref:acetate--CoA ligase family protein n=1 Tax=Castellaniella sp. TaxID=1955812 RepID=UPI003564A1A1
MNTLVNQDDFIRALMDPRRVALVGVSSNAKKNTARPLLFMRKHGFSGRIYPVNPQHDEVLGVQAYAALSELPEPVDHVFIMVAHDLVEDLLEECATAGAKVVTVYSDGFGESGPDGVQRQAKLVQRARALGLRLLGPNSIGLANIASGCIISVNAAFAADDLVPGHVSMVSQSGSMMGSLLSRAAARGFGFAKSISVGNEADISVGEILNALVDDENTHSILLFLETIREAPILAAALRRAYDAGKPVIVYKLGRSELGEVLSRSHTGAIAGDDAAMGAFLRAHGAIRVRTLEALFETLPMAEAYAKDAVPIHDRKPRVAIMTTTGGGAATVVDAMGLMGLEAVSPPVEFVERMAQRGLRLRPSPVIDLTMAASGVQYQDLLEQLLQAPWCDGVLSVVGSSAQFHPEYAVRPLIGAHRPADKPLAVFLAPEAGTSLRLLYEQGIAAFRTPESCADALSAFLYRNAPEPTDVGGGVPIWPADVPKQGPLNEFEAIQVFDALGICTASAQLLQGCQQQHDLPYPVVAKICSRDIPHKTEVNGVRTDIMTADALQEQTQDLLADVARRRPQARLDGVLVQSMERGLIELILGYRRDPLVGPTVILGAGGIAAELNQDYSIRLAPVGLSTARQMITEVRLTRLVRGYRNLPQGDIDALADAIVRFSHLADLDSPVVEEAEVNPLFVQENGVVAIDALVRVA